MMLNWFPENISTYGDDLDSVYLLILYVVGFWFILAEGTIIYFIIRYFRRENKKASYVSGETLRQASWVLIPGLIVLVLDLGIDFAGAKAYHKFKEVPVGDYVVEVKGKQFNWEMTYPGPDEEFGTEDDLTIENELHVPVNKAIRIILKSEDVLHAIFVPVLRLKQDIIPGREINVWFEATKSGDFEIACAELCGYAHYTMRGFLFIHSEAEYSEWVNAQWPYS